MDSLWYRIYLNEFAIKCAQYVLIFVFGKRLFKVMMDTEIGYNIHHKPHEQLLLDLKQIETEFY